LMKEVGTWLDEGWKPLAVFLDLAKAFDTVSHTRLLKAMRRLGFSEGVVRWFGSYLHNRRQCVKLNNVFSDYQTVKMGIPQGTVIGPCLFLIYINEMCNLDIPGKIISFADDTVLLFAARSWDGVCRVAAEGTAAVKRWLDFNRLSLNLSKTKYLAFSYKKSGAPENVELRIHKADCVGDDCGCCAIERVSELRYLGVTVDQHLKWDAHIAQLVARARKLIYVFAKLRPILPVKMLKTVYFSLAQSIFQYGILAFGGTVKTLLHSLEIVQKRIIKIILKKEMSFPTRQLFREFKVLTIRQLFTKQIIIYFVNNEDMQFLNRRLTRQEEAGHVMVPRMRTSAGQRLYLYLAPMAYNNLPPTLRSKKTHKRFGFHLNQFFLTEEGWEVAERLLGRG